MPAFCLHWASCHVSHWFVSTVGGESRARPWSENEWMSGININNHNINAAVALNRSCTVGHDRSNKT